MTHTQAALRAQRNELHEPTGYQPWFQVPSRAPAELEPAGVWEPCQIGTIPDDLDIWSDRD